MPHPTKVGGIQGAGGRVLGWAGRVDVCSLKAAWISTNIFGLCEAAEGGLDEVKRSCKARVM